MYIRAVAVVVVVVGKHTRKYSRRRTSDDVSLPAQCSWDAERGMSSARRATDVVSAFLTT